MILERATYEPCPKCGAEKRVGKDIYGCEVCEVPVDASGLVVHVFPERTLPASRMAPEYIFCSWVHVFEFLRRLNLDGVGFITLPSIPISGDLATEKTSYAALMELCGGDLILNGGCK